MIFNAVMWLFIHIAVSGITAMAPASFIRFLQPLLRTKSWEGRGRIYRSFGIHKWKTMLPEARKWVNKGRGKTAASIRNVYAYDELGEQLTRSELSHWMQIFPAPLFFLFNPPWAGWVMIMYALLFNLPFIMIQRYNRARVSHLSDRILHAFPEK
ncbi:hypothetical protein [Halobacillus sp. Cin3]|uniref:glycosyl-4,4'-diaponeurosporenoate acyltransferase CrtO family protein n=1 Tax=Halobacillus sp. Cin3 TaxID=2928441 RepID=UPI00248DC95C|nr:hypothetical protein [Halobacillus sp. Cin3]